MSSKQKPETVLSNAIRDALAWEPGLLLWRNSTGVFRAPGIGRVHAGLPSGSADLIGVLRVSAQIRSVDLTYACTLGRFIALEVKLPGQRADPHQEAWLQSVRNVGGFACVVTSQIEGLAAIRRARNGATE